MILRAKKDSIVAPVAIMAAATGARTFTGLAAAARSGSAEAARAATTLASLEVVADTLPGIGRRIDTWELAGRVAAGAVIGAAVARRTGHDRAAAAAVGAASAFVSAHISYRLRGALTRRLPRVAAALLEDVAIFALAAAGARRIPRRRRWREVLIHRKR